MSFITKFWKTKSTMEVLEDIDQAIKSISKYKRSSQQSKEKIFWRLSFFTFFLSVVSAVLLYFFTPQTVTNKVIVTLTFTVSPLIIYFINKFLHWWQNSKVSKYEKQLSDLQEKRKEILENVMETETYKRAKEILEKFDPETKKKVEDEMMRKNQPTPVPSPVVAANQELRHRNSNSNGNPRPHQPNGSNVPPGVNRPPLPRPILNSHRTMLDKIMEYCVGDGPSNRFALICKNCYSHNGMALAEEFEYLGYRCAYCRFYNDSRKKKPGAPQIFASPKPPTSPSSIKSKSPRIFDNSSLPDHFESISRRTTPASSVTGESLPGSEPKDEDKSSDDERVLVDQTSGDHNKVDFAKSLNKDAS